MKMYLITSELSHHSVTIDYVYRNCSFNDFCDFDVIAILCSFNMVNIVKNRYGVEGIIRKQQFDKMVQDQVFIENHGKETGVYGFEAVNFYRGLNIINKENNKDKEEFLKEYALNNTSNARGTTSYDREQVFHDAIKIWNKIQQECN